MPPCHAQIQSIALGALRSSTLTSEVSLASWKRLLGLALGRDLACGEPPPFALVQIVEGLGLDSLAPDLATPAEIIGSALVAVADNDQADTIRAAHEFMAEVELAKNWFGAGEDARYHSSNAVASSTGARAMLNSASTDPPGLLGSLMRAIVAGVDGRLSSRIAASATAFDS